jgi:hypothetical protein
LWSISSSITLDISLGAEAESREARTVDKLAQMLHLSHRCTTKLSLHHPLEGLFILPLIHSATGNKSIKEITDNSEQQA